MHVLSIFIHSKISLAFGWRDGTTIYDYRNNENDSDYDPGSEPDHYHSDEDNLNSVMNEEQEDEDKGDIQEEELENINENNKEYTHMIFYLERNFKSNIYSHLLHQYSSLPLLDFLRMDQFYPQKYFYRIFARAYVFFLNI